MRKWIVFMAAVCLAAMALVAVTPSAQARNTSRKRKPQPQAEANLTLEQLAELVRRAEQAAIAAQVEARRAREQTEAMQQQLAQTTREIADCGLRIADLKNEVGRLQAAISKAAEKEGGQLSANPQSAIRNPQSSDNPQSDSRLTTLEEQVEINSAQIKEHAQTKVESDSRFRVKLSGMILVNTFLNTGDSSVRSTPTRAPSPTDLLGQT
ncbi:MAG: hypothetical protein ABIP14_11565, partial [Blastocatellia bacterium]